MKKKEAIALLKKIAAESHNATKEHVQNESVTIHDAVKINEGMVIGLCLAVDLLSGTLKHSDPNSIAYAGLGSAIITLKINHPEVFDPEVFNDGE